MSKEDSLEIDYSKWKFEISTLDYYVFSNKGRYIVLKKRGNIEWKFQLPIGALKNLLNKNSLTERMLRLESRAAEDVGNNQIVIAICGYIFFIDLNKKKIKLDHRFRDGMKAPLSFCKYIGSDGRSHLLYGDYFSNDKRDPVAIYERSIEGWKKVFEFEAGTVKHIHQIAYDEYHDLFYIATGDSDEESAIWALDTSFGVIKKVCGGKQIYRTCFIIPSANGFYYLTDSPMNSNYYMEYDLKRNNIKKNCSIAGPCIYGIIGKDDAFFVSTSVEPNPELSKFKYLFSLKQKGKGVSDWKSHIYKGSCKGDSLEEILMLDKDFFPMGLFQFGTVRFRVCNDNKIVGIPIALKSKIKTIMFGA